MYDLNVLVGVWEKFFFIFEGKVTQASLKNVIKVLLIKSCFLKGFYVETVFVFSVTQGFFSLETLRYVSHYKHHQ